MAIQNGLNGHVVNGGFKRTPATPIGDLPAALPQVNLPEDVNVTEIAAEFLPKLSSLTVDDFAESAFWRDSFALTGTFRTFSSRDLAFEAWKETSGKNGPVDFSLVPGAARVFRIPSVSSWVDARFTFRTTTSVPRLTCSGYISLIPDENGQWKLWLLRTILENIEGTGDVDNLAPQLSNDASNGESNGTTSGDSKHDQDDFQHFDCIVIGGGQAGLGIGGRLQAVGVSYLIVDKHPVVGDSWQTRYDSTKRKRMHVSMINAMKLTPIQSTQLENMVRLKLQCIYEPMGLII